MPLPTSAAGRPSPALPPSRTRWNRRKPSATRRLRREPGSARTRYSAWTAGERSRPASRCSRRPGSANESASTTATASGGDGSARRRSIAHLSARPLPRALGSVRCQTSAPASPATRAVESLQLSAMTITRRCRSGQVWARSERTQRATSSSSLCAGMSTASRCPEREAAKRGGRRADSARVKR